MVEAKVKSTESFIIKVPKESVSNNEITIKVNAKAVGKEQYMAYEYQPDIYGFFLRRISLSGIRENQIGQNGYVHTFCE